MEHALFVEKFRRRHISVHINKKKAGFLYGQEGLMPQDMRAKQAWLRAMAFGGLFIGLTALFYAPWWVAIGIMLMAWAAFPYVQNSGVQGVLQAALDNRHVYEIAVQAQILRVEEFAKPNE